MRPVLPIPTGGGGGADDPLLAGGGQKATYIIYIYTRNSRGDRPVFCAVGSRAPCRIRMDVVYWYANIRRRDDA